MAVATGPPNVPESWSTAADAPAHLASAAELMLEVAALDTIFSWEPALNETPLEDIRAQLTRIVQAVRDELKTGRVPHFEIPTWLPAGRLLDALRRCFLARAQASTYTASGVLRVLDALERVQQHVEQDIVQRFRSRLGGSDALELLAEVAHDMRSPLASILFLVESMRQGSDDLPAALPRRLGLVYGAAFGLSTLAENLFDLARGADLVLEPKPIPFSLEETMHAVRDIVLPIAEEKGLRIEFERHGIDCRVGHPLALQRVLLNLSTNGLKFTAKGSVRLRARDVGGARVLFEIRDTGRGIEPDTLESITSAFRPIKQLGRIAFSTPGLGLSICQKLVTLMGGALGIQSVVGQGTRFFFELELPLPTEG
jgi:signal transduction histidine kinase